MKKLTLILALLACPIVSATELTPVATPYAPQRKLLTTDSLLLDWKDPTRTREIPIKVYFPVEPAGSYPVILFSHGLGGTRMTYEYLGRQWAGHGYVVVHLQHPGSDDSAWRGQQQPMQSMRDAASGQNAIDRAKDVRFALDQLKLLNRDHEKLKGKLNLNSIGLAGHSFGANTSLLLAGQQLGGPLVSNRVGKLSDDRIKAVIPMSAPVPVMRNNLDFIYGSITIPTFIMTGTEDDSPLSDTKAAERRIPYDRIKKNAYLLILNGGDHMVFSGRLADRQNDAEFQKLVRVASTAFWDSYLKTDTAAKAWLDGPGLKQTAGTAAAIERK